MDQIPHRRWKLLFAALTLMPAGCETGAVRGQCGSDSACAAGLHCVSGECVCTSNSDCMAGESCNSSGFCQSNLGCQDSLQCPTGTICDTTSGNCIGLGQCTQDTECPLGQVCNAINFTCVAGCHDVGDCPLGDVCECPPGQTCRAGELLSCISGPCEDDSWCQFGDICVARTDGGQQSCVHDTRGPFCQPCTLTPGNPVVCPGSAPNFCLLDPDVTDGASFCGVDCSQGQECPNGFECSDVLILTQNACTPNGALCQLAPAPSCQSDADCANQRGGSCDQTTHKCVCVTDTDCPGGECEPVSGQCRPSCEISEGAHQGYCTCLEDSDCPTDTCDDESQRCLFHDSDCDPAASSSCPPMFCKKVADPLSGAITGYCFIGQNCAPEPGVTCSQVLANEDGTP